jgi:hypothetical protein
MAPTAATVVPMWFHWTGEEVRILDFQTRFHGAWSAASGVP